MRRLVRKKRLKLSIITLTIIIASLCAYYFYRREQAQALANFKPGNIMSDYVMGDYDTMNEAQIQAFLKSKNHCNDRDINKAKRYPNVRYNIRDGHFVCMADDLFDGESAAHIIWQASQDYRINPQVLLVLLEKEQGLVTDTWPNHIQYRTATGFGCPDTAPCDAQYFGLKNQIRLAAKLFRSVLDGGWSNYPVGNNFIQYNPNKACGGSNVYIENRATSALYRYTPYQPNAGALAAGWGLALPCGAYGNRNFYLYFKKWFGNQDGLLIRSNKGDIYLVKNKVKRPFPSSLIFASYGFSIENTILMSDEEIAKITAGAPMPHLREGKLITTDRNGVYFVQNATRRPFPTAAVFVSYGYRMADAITIKNEEMTAIPLGTAMPNKHEGKLITTDYNGIYLVENGLKRPFPSGVVFSSHGYTLANVIRVSTQEVNLLQMGEVMTPKINQ